METLISLISFLYQLDPYLMQHIDEEAGLARQETLPSLQCEFEAGLQNVGGVRLLESRTQCKETVVDEQQFIPDAAGEIR